jgi:peptidyl-prolyl cis-trans isomerase SurA
MLSQTRPVLVLLLSVLALACRTDSAQRAGGASPAVTADTWAVVDGRQLTRDEVEKAYRRVSDPSQTLSNEEVLAAKLSLLNDLIVQDLLLAKARELKIELPDSELDAAYTQAKQNLADEAFQQELKRRNLTPGDMRDGLRRELLSQKVLEREVTSKVNVTEQEITEYFNANRAQFNLAEDAYHLAQIVVTPNPDAPPGNRAGDDAATPQAAAAKVQMLMERLKAGASFRELAADYSEDPESGPRGGDLGLVPVSRLRQVAPQLRDAVLKSEPGRVQVVSLPGAYTIVLVVAHEKAGQRDLSMPEVRENITQALRGRKEQLLRAAYLTALRTDADVENYFARRLLETQGQMPVLAPSAPGTAR